MPPVTALNSVPLSLRPVSLLENEPQRSMEMRLMYHYARVVCYEMPDWNPQATKAMWKEAIPQMAFGFSIVLDPLLALSAMHLSYVHGLATAYGHLILSRSNTC